MNLQHEASTEPLQTREAQALRVLALEPFYGGSHKAFLDGWIANSCHQFTVLSLPPYKWKWRMRHSAVTLSSQLQSPPYRDQAFDVLWCSDMLNLAEFLGLAPEPIRRLPRVVYFHENQLTYPVRVERDRDLHFAYTNLTTCLAANEVWFNSAFHQHEFATALTKYLGRMPDYPSLDLPAAITDKSSVHYPGIHEMPLAIPRQSGPLRIVWNARWEHDKNPEGFFAAMRILKDADFPFQLLVLGESFGDVPDVFSSMRDELSQQILHWGYADNVDEYHRLLNRGDIVVSTAHHEFFGIAILEAMAAGCVPLVPDRLAYPEVLANCYLPIDPKQLIYGQTPNELAAAIRALGTTLADTAIRQSMSNAVAPLLWKTRAYDLDEKLTGTCTGTTGRGTH